MALKDRLIELQNDRPEISKADMARIAEVSRPSVSDWFSGKTQALKADSAIRLAQAYGVTVHWLTEGTLPKHPTQDVIKPYLVTIATLLAHVPQEQMLSVQAAIVQLVTSRMAPPATPAQSPPGLEEK